MQHKIEMFWSRLLGEITAESINKTVTNLNRLFTTSGCDEQICEIIEGQLPSTVKGGALVHFYECHFFSPAFKSTLVGKKINLKSIPF